MKKTILALVGVGLAILAVQALTLPPPASQALTKPSGVLEDSDLKWRLLPSEQKYGSIDGPHLKSYVEDQTAISRRYRNKGHQFWGRIIGTEADAENAEWLSETFRKFGLADVHEQSFDLPPQWIPQSWSVAVSGGGKTLEIASAQPTYLAKATPAGGLDLEAVDAGFGSEADLAGREFRGKAVFFYSADVMSRHDKISGGAIKRIEELGAAAIFVTVMIPGNLKLQLYPVGANIPTFALGLEHGLAVRDLIGFARRGEAPRVKLQLDVKMVPNLKTRTI